MNQVININGRAVERIQYKEQPVITMPMMDELHERPTGTAGRNFRSNKKHMIDGEDFFSVPQDEVNQLFGRRNSSAKRGGHRGAQIILTKSGYGILVKSFNDDLAWEVQRALVNHYFSEQQVKAPARRTEIEYSRRTNAPEGLDIRYTLDLTKLVMKPNQAGIELVERLTGIDMSGIVINTTANVTSDLADQVFTEWVLCLQPAQDQGVLFATLYADFQQAYLAVRGNDPAPVPSRIWLGKQLRKNGYQTSIRGGDSFVWGVELVGVG